MMDHLMAQALQVCYAPASPSAATARITTALSSVTESQLRAIVDAIATPRHYTAEPEANRSVAQWISNWFQQYGYEVESQGEYANILALPKSLPAQPWILVGAHYDSVPGSPGADDNASAVAAMLAVARSVAGWAPPLPVGFVAFNREEDQLTGSIDFVQHYLPRSGLSVREAHVLEMVGYCDHRPGSQKIPAELPLKLRDVGDFLGLISNSRSAPLIDAVLEQAGAYLTGFPVIGLKVQLGLERRISHLERSDHAPFWRTGLPALMWTDTSEFRNPHYHQATDTPDTLDYSFLRSTTQLLLAYLLNQETKFSQGQ